MDGLRVCHTERKRKRKTNIICECIYVEYRKMVPLILFAKRNRDRDVENKDIENKCMDTKRGKSGSGMDWGTGIDIYAPLIPCTK